MYLCLSAHETGTDMLDPQLKHHRKTTCVSICADLNVPVFVCPWGECRQESYALAAPHEEHLRVCLCRSECTSVCASTGKIRRTFPHQVHRMRRHTLSQALDPQLSWLMQAICIATTVLDSASCRKSRQPLRSSTPPLPSSAWGL